MVRRLIRDNGLDPASITGTGAGGRITRDDVLRRIDAGASAPAPAPALLLPQRPKPLLLRRVRRRRPWPVGHVIQSIKLSKIRRLTGEHMVASKATSPHALSVVEVDCAGTWIRVRDAAKAEWKVPKVSASPTCRLSRGDYRRPPRVPSSERIG